MKHVFLRAGLVLALSGCDTGEAGCGAECMNNKADIAVLQSQLAIHEGRLKELENAKTASDERQAVAEANISTLFEKPKASSGGWIIWESKSLAANPRGVLFASLPKARPLGSYDDQSSCMQDGIQTAKANGGNGKDTRFLTEGSSGVTWLNTYTCLPKDVDPR